MHYGSGSVVPSRSAGFTNTGSPRPARPGQLDQMMADNIAGGADPAEINEMCHASAAALLDRVHHTQDAELVERVLTLAKRLNMLTVAEGVETPEQARWLSERGVNFMQGYWISRPLPLDDFVRWLKKPYTPQW